MFALKRHGPTPQKLGLVIGGEEYLPRWRSGCKSRTEIFGIGTGIARVDNIIVHMPSLIV